MSNYRNNSSIKNWAEDDRPREKFILKGRSVLSDAELLAIQLGSGSRYESALDLAKRILASVSGSYTKLARLSVEELVNFNGVGEAKAINILSALEIGRRRKFSADEDSLIISSSKKIFDLFSYQLRDVEHEEFWCLFLSNSNKILRKENISKGGLTSTVVDVRLILKRAVLLSATSMILVHNHPSGSIKPSQADISLTKKIKEASDILDISLLDHLIMGDDKYFSFADENML
ncbi:MAG: DNA repair protein RadC [Bacteroidota bacterium]